MALRLAYKQFLSAPSTSFLSEDSSLHYVTTLVSYNHPSEIIKHLNGQTRLLKKKEEKFLDVIEGENGLAVEIHTTIEFVTGGGAYLPGLDDNFLADRVVTLPIIHLVSFDGKGKITQIRQNWDQGSLLKVIDVIGRTGRNWPIRDGKDQINLIISSTKSANRAVGGPTAAEQPEELVRRSRENSTHVTRDPHASLSLFAPREESNEESLPAVVAPRASARPPPRDYSELFVGGESDQPPNSEALQLAVSRERSASPSKHSAGIAPKAGAGKNFQPSRLFDNDENSPMRPSHEKSESFYRPHPKKFEHFDITHENVDQDAAKPAPATVKSKHASQWNFDDFKTPQKVVPTKVLRGQDVVHWGTENDEVVDSPVKVKKSDKPRKDAETHFEFQDDGTPENGRRLVGRPRGAGVNNGLELYQNHLYDEDENVSAQPTAHVLHNVVNIKDRTKDFDPHFVMTDDSPADAKNSEKYPQDKIKAVKMMDANWAGYDQSPTANQKENAAPSNSVASSTRSGFGKGPLSESTNTLSTNTMSKRNDNPKGISTAGDGMGGKKGTGRSWGFGDESDDDSNFKKGFPGKKQGTNIQTSGTGGDFWEF